MAVYLALHPPATSQYKPNRGRNPTGAIVLHTAENTPDFDPPDDGAEKVAHWIATRPDPGSYHSAVDSDGIERIGEYGWLMYGESTGGNAWALHLAAACRAQDWATDTMWVHNTVWNLAAEARAMAAWCKAVYGIGIPARRITATDYRAGQPGFVAHADLDPGRRSDPGTGFPWAEFLSFYSQGDTPMPTADPYVEAMQKTLNAAGVQPQLTIDGLAGPKTVKALADVLGYQQWRMTTMADTLTNISGIVDAALHP